MDKKKDLTPRIILLGSITEDIIDLPEGTTFRSLGGILYQASVFCAFKKPVGLWAHLGKNLVNEFRRLTSGWRSLSRAAVKVVSWPGNRVHLYYPPRGEREEILENVVPPLNLKNLARRFSAGDFIMAVINSGFDFRREDWQWLVKRIDCPTWLDIHSLVLEQILGQPRRYRSLPDWPDWARGVTFLQANQQELACLLGNPQEKPTLRQMIDFSQQAASFGVEAVVVTLGRAGVFLGEGNKGEILAPPVAVEPVDTTGCGDVLAAATVIGLKEGQPIRDALRQGMELAVVAAQVKGVEAIFQELKNYLDNLII
ncbi:MAG: hypothetical protein DRJ06_09290 [Candidatus Aminicenantes bacterium]|nr:MAG: hypothetical protein DRJ06_09290 [Candidatus Aminicenantes bacterium]